MQSLKSYVITLVLNQTSVAASENCIASARSNTKLDPVKTMVAVTDTEAQAKLKAEKLRWTYPSQGERLDIPTGLKLSAYPTVNLNARIACAMSHYFLWQVSVESNEPILILEHDAFFVKNPPIEEILDSKYGCIGLNSPIGATRRASIYDAKVRGAKDSGQKFMRPPVVDNYMVPQGLAGNSSYIIKPEFAKKAIATVKEHGVWPNDALLNQQLFSDLGITTTYYTKVQGTRSTTSL
jgi:GR25 family glycosyltransferase involved in LPS biosynthesis